MRCAIARALFLCALALNAHAVGFTQLKDVAVWYPSAQSAETPITLADYYADPDAMKQFMSGAGVSAETIAAYMNLPMRARRDAPVARGRHPLILVGQGNGHSFADQARLCEALAQRGYVVATTPSPMLITPMTSEDDVGKFAELQAAQLKDAIATVAAKFTFDTNRIGFVGHSFGARAGLFLAMNDPRVKALVSLDGGIGTATAVNSMKAAPSYKPGRVPPVLHFYQGNPDLTFLRGVGSSSLHTERVEGLQHVHFSTLGFAAAQLPELARITRAGEQLSKSVEHITNATIRFLDRHLKPKTLTWKNVSIATAAVIASTALDEPVRDLARANTSPRGDDLSEVIGPFGGRYSDRVMAAFLLGGLVTKNDRAKRIALESFVSSLAASKVITPVLKQAIGRDRPNETDGAFEFGGGSAFPSNHATQAFAVATVIAAHYDARWIDATAYGLAGLVGLSRIYDDAHWLSDTIGGALIGHATARIVVRANERRRSKWTVMPLLRGDHRGIVVALTR